MNSFRYFFGFSLIIGALAGGSPAQQCCPSAPQRGIVVDPSKRADLPPVQYAVAVIEQLPAVPPDKPSPKKHGRGHKLPPKEVRDYMHRVSELRHGHIRKTIPVASDTVYDLRIFGTIPPTGDQGQCGDCHLWSGAKVCSSATMAAKVVAQDGKFMLSVQYLLDCHSELGGCNGGDEYTDAQVYIKGGPSVTDYPGAGQSEGNCKSLTGMKMYTVTNLIMVGASSGVAPTQDIKNYLKYYNSYVSVAGAAGNWDNVGPNSTITGNDTNVDHAIGIVGWDDGHDNGNGTKGAWIMSNQWGEGWGGPCTNSANPSWTTGGYAWVAYGADSLGTEAFVAVVGNGPTPPTPPTPVPPTPVPPTPVPPSPTNGPIFMAADGSSLVYFPPGQTPTLIDISKWSDEEKAIAGIIVEKHKKKDKK